MVRVASHHAGLAGVVPPSVYPPAKRMEMANSSVWAIDKIPSRIEIIHNMLATKFDKPAVIYVTLPRPPNPLPSLLITRQTTHQLVHPPGALLGWL